MRSYGFPISKVNDRGSQLTAHLWKIVCERYGIKIKFPSAHYPETDGQTEFSGTSHVLSQPHETAQERVTDNGITIYGDSSTYNRLSAVAKAYHDIWRDKGGVVNIPEKDWMENKTVNDAKPMLARVFRLGLEDRAVVDKEFDAMHKSGKMEWTTKPTPFAYPVFVVWRTIHLPGKTPERKGRVVIDIRGLNKLSEFDAYPIPLQADVTSAIQGCTYISVMDGAGFFHQWPVKKSDRHKLTVVSHR